MRALLQSITVVAILALPSAAFAATMRAVSNVSDTSVGQFVVADILLEPEGKVVNAVAGQLIIPENFEVIDVLDGKSMIGLWIEPPTAHQSVIPFSGVIPGGFSEPRGLLFTVRMRAISDGKVQLAIDQGEVLLNDGLGTSAPFATRPLAINITKSGLFSVLPVTVQDTEPPEPFKPIVSRHEAIFEGRAFIAFSAEDKSSGIDHYEVKEANGAWERAENPYVLKDQGLKSKIAVKAIDAFGNARIATLPATHVRAWYERPEIWCILLVVLLGGVVLWRSLRIKSRV